MKILITTSSLLIVGITLFFFIQSYLSKAYAAPGLAIPRLSASEPVTSELTSKQLRKCPNTPNCICSEFISDTAHFFEPIKMPVNLSANHNAELMTQIQSILKEMGASSISTTDDYIAATFTSTIFRFVDDFEIRIDKEKQLIHLRSASRTGKSDFGVNRKRANVFLNLINNPNSRSLH